MERSLEEYFALNASTERVFRGFRGRFKRSPTCIITAELVVGLHRPEFKIKAATTLDMKRSWKEYPDIVYSVAREAAKTRATFEQVNRFCCIQSRAKGAVGRVDIAEEIKQLE